MNKIKLEWYFYHNNHDDYKDEDYKYKDKYNVVKEITVVIRGSLHVPKYVYDAYLLEFIKKYIWCIYSVERDDYLNGEWRTFVTLSLSPNKENELLIGEFPGFRYVD